MSNEPDNNEIITISDDMLVAEKINFEYRMSYFPVISLTEIDWWCVITELDWYYWRGHCIK
ncbi:hypothetical protein THII_2846 [Thioploca ingrica]|uniref:Uncharacterized protein n=1 Tax=Thioploca ingrica TaxID=40754 RepID=A0A090AG35_9GAMM|nr:hypothetical protein THII_2846 [Thioploca ingrica]